MAPLMQNSQLQLSKFKDIFHKFAIMSYSSGVLSASDQVILFRYIQVHSLIPSQQGDLVEIYHLVLAPFSYQCLKVCITSVFADFGANMKMTCSSI